MDYTKHKKIIHSYLERNYTIYLNNSCLKLSKKKYNKKTWSSTVLLGVIDGGDRENVVWECGEGMKRAWRWACVRDDHGDDREGGLPWSLKMMNDDDLWWGRRWRRSCREFFVEAAVTLFFLWWDGDMVMRRRGRGRVLIRGFYSFLRLLLSHVF